MICYDTKTLRVNAWTKSCRFFGVQVESQIQCRRNEENEESPLSKCLAKA